MTKEQRRRCFVISRLALKLTNWLSEEFKKSASRHSNEISFFGESFNCFLGIFPLFFGEKKERNEGGTHEQLLLQWGQQQQEFVFIRANSAISPHLIFWGAYKLNYHLSISVSERKKVGWEKWLLWDCLQLDGQQQSIDIFMAAFCICIYDTEILIRLTSCADNKTSLQHFSMRFNTVSTLCRGFN